MNVAYKYFGIILEFILHVPLHLIIGNSATERSPFYTAKKVILQYQISVFIYFAGLSCN